jgi:hypothetical protein
MEEFRTITWSRGLDATGPERLVNIEMLRVIYTLASGKTGNARLIAGLVREVQRQAMERRNGVRREREGPVEFEMEEFTIDQMLARIPVEDWPTPEPNHSPEPICISMAEYKEKMQLHNYTIALKGKRYITKNGESTVHVHIARLLGLHLFTNHRKERGSARFAEKGWRAWKNKTST